MKKLFNGLLAIGLFSVVCMADANTKVVETRDRAGLFGSGGFLGTGIGRRDKTVIIEKECGPCNQAGHTEVKKDIKKGGGLFRGRDETLIIKETECCDNKFNENVSK